MEDNDFQSKLELSSRKGRQCFQEKEKEIEKCMESLIFSKWSMFFPFHNYEQNELKN